jgi:hypothetical protein
MEGNPTYLTLKEASARLGVHPNTLRNWEQRGLVRLARLPGSRYRRVPVYEVQRLEQEMEGEGLAKTAPSGATRAVEAIKAPSTHDTFWSVRIEPPDTDPAAVAEARALAESIQAKLAETEPGMTLDEMIWTLRGYPEIRQMEGGQSPAEVRVIETERVRIELPSDDPVMIAEGRAMAERIKARLAELDLGTLEETMQALRGRSWSS